MRTVELGEAIVSGVLQTNGFVKPIELTAHRTTYEGVGSLRYTCKPNRSHAGRGGVQSLHGSRSPMGMCSMETEEPLSCSTTPWP